MNVVKEIQRINDREASRGIGSSASWHDQYKGSAYVFAGGFPFDLTEGDLITIFSQYGEISDINLVRDKDTGKSRGFAFLAYEDQRSTTLAVDNLNGAKVLGRVLRVDHVQDYKHKEKKDGDEFDFEAEQAKARALSFDPRDMQRNASELGLRSAVGGAPPSQAKQPVSSAAALDSVVDPMAAYFEKKEMKRIRKQEKMDKKLLKMIKKEKKAAAAAALGQPEDTEQPQQQQQQQQQQEPVQQQEEEQPPTFSVGVPSMRPDASPPRKARSRSRSPPRRRSRSRSSPRRRSRSRSPSYRRRSRSPPRRRSRSRSRDRSSRRRSRTPPRHSRRYSRSPPRRR